MEAGPAILMFYLDSTTSTPCVSGSVFVMKVIMVNTKSEVRFSFSEHGRVLQKTKSQNHRLTRETDIRLWEQNSASLKKSVYPGFGKRLDLASVRGRRDSGEFSR
jgi:hypothetical protein